MIFKKILTSHKCKRCLTSSMRRLHEDEHLAQPHRGHADLFLDNWSCNGSCAQVLSDVPPPLCAPSGAPLALCRYLNLHHICLSLHHALHDASRHRSTQQGRLQQHLLGSNRVNDICRHETGMTVTNSPRLIRPDHLHKSETGDKPHRKKTCQGEFCEDGASMTFCCTGTACKQKHQKDEWEATATLLRSLQEVCCLGLLPPEILPRGIAEPAACRRPLAGQRCRKASCCVGRPISVCVWRSPKKSSDQMPPAHQILPPCKYQALCSGQINRYGQRLASAIQSTLSAWLICQLTSPRCPWLICAVDCIVHVLDLTTYSALPLHGGKISDPKPTGAIT